MNWIIKAWIELPLFLGVVGVILCGLGFLRQRNPGFALLGLLFLYPIYQEIAWWMYKHNFVQTEIAPGHWSAPIRDVSALYPVGMLILFFAALLFVRAAGQRRKAPVGADPC